MSVIMSPEEFEKLKALMPEGQHLKLGINGVDVDAYEVIFRPVREASTGRVVFAWGVNIGGENLIVGDGSWLTVCYKAENIQHLFEGSA